ncbi:PREDICTED: DNA repair protein complementing XP-A cells homolog [Ceratosolen solmsi marchali]|uniref:DNA repair protein complementing XP-A cells homolog n=1 Tax=Ceratosolen solmsi marchali TaxID=326594 RepID=A0AAJ6YL73_9HYME|nr:PREDICTED: DNA repair protein complementing XP-A cells homolog [Ceratosolen solmsi marchali]
MKMSQDKNIVDTSNEKVNDGIRKRIEKNKERALLLRKAKVVSHPPKRTDNQNGITGKVIKVQGQKVIDSGAGFLIEENDDLEAAMCSINPPAPIISKLPECQECKKEFKDSFLLQKFDYLACDNCRDNDDKHSLITRTEAKQEYLLKDCDIDKREPPLKYILRKNPHNVHWGEMKLYLQIQIEERALQVWGSEEALLEEREKRESNRQEAKIKKFNRKVKKLRMEVRSSLYDKTKKASHTHQFGEDTYNEDDDTYTHTCTTCGFEDTYEKM